MNITPEMEAMVIELVDARLAKKAREESEKKQEDNAWRRFKKRLRAEIYGDKDFASTWWMVEHCAAIARDLWRVHSVTRFTEADSDRIYEMLQEFIAVAKKYKHTA